MRPRSPQGRVPIGMDPPGNLSKARGKDAKTFAFVGRAPEISEEVLRVRRSFDRG